MNYDKEPIVVFTPYTFDQMREYQRFIFRSLRYVFYFMAAVLVLYFIQLLTAGLETSAIHQLLVDDDYSFIPTGLLPVLIPVFLVAFIGAQSFGLFYTKKKHNEMTVHAKEGQTYYFRNIEFDVEMHSPDAEGKTACGFDTIRSAAETDKMFYLFTAKYQAYLVDKNGFKKGSPEKFRKLLRLNIPPSRCKLFK